MEEIQAARFERYDFMILTAYKTDIGIIRKI